MNIDLNSQLTSENSNLIAKVKSLEQSNAEKEMTINLIRKVRNEKMFVSMWMNHIFNFSYLLITRSKLTKIKVKIYKKDLFSLQMSSEVKG